MGSPRVWSETPSPKSTPLVDAVMACVPRCNEDGTAHSIKVEDRRRAGDGCAAPILQKVPSSKLDPVTRKMSPRATPWDGVTSVTNLDYSGEVIAALAERHEIERPEMRWVAMDAADLDSDIKSGFADGSFDVLVDKV